MQCVYVCVCVCVCLFVYCNNLVCLCMTDRPEVSLFLYPRIGNFCDLKYMQFHKNYHNANFLLMRLL